MYDLEPDRIKLKIKQQTFMNRQNFGSRQQSEKQTSKLMILVSLHPLKLKL